MIKTREDYALVYFRKEPFSDIGKGTFLKFLNWWADLRIVFFLNSDSIARRCSIKKVFINILQNSQENNFSTVSFLICLQVPRQLEVRTA